MALGALVARTALAPVARFTRRTEELAADPDPSQEAERLPPAEREALHRDVIAGLDELTAGVRLDEIVRAVVTRARARERDGLVFDGPWRLRGGGERSGRRSADEGVSFGSSATA